jgi:hypothetical protein
MLSTLRATAFATARALVQHRPSIPSRAPPLRALYATATGGDPPPQRKQKRMEPTPAFVSIGTTLLEGPGRCDCEYKGVALLRSATCRWMYYNAETVEIRVLEHAQRCESCEELSS